MPSYFDDNADLLFTVDHLIPWDEIVPLVEPRLGPGEAHESVQDAVAFYRETLALVGEFVAEQVAPVVPRLDRQPPRIQDGEVVHPPEFTALFDQIRDLGLHGMCIPRGLGGMGCPMMLYFLTAELFARADVSVLAHFGFHQGIALALLFHALQDPTAEVDLATGEFRRLRFREAIEEMARGEAWGSMDITEANAGSDMAALRCRAEQDEAGRWFVTGEKIFITSGHGKYHVVIARSEPRDVPETAGLRGLSLFLVPAYARGEDGEERRVVTLERLEEKLGHHASPTVTATFDRTPAELIGERGRGFAGMLLLMNNARLGVGFECLGLAEAAYRAARDYAEQREAFGKPIAQHELVADRLEEMRTDIQALRALAVHGAVQEELGRQLAYRVRHGDLSDAARERLRKQMRRHQREARRITPLVKYLGAEKAVEIARRGIQIHGGVGYTTDYPAEKLMRDALVMPIYEGTSQMQALMAMKDAFSAAMRRPQAFLAQHAQVRWRSLSAADPRARRVAGIQSLSMAAQEHLLSRTVADKLHSLRRQPPATWVRAVRQNWDPKRDFTRAMRHAEHLTRLLADAAIAEILLAQAQSHPEREGLLDRFLDRAEVRARFLLDTITSDVGGRRAARSARSD